jgi:hypothetical protein
MAQFDVNCRSCKKKNHIQTTGTEHAPLIILIHWMFLYTTLGVSVDSEGQHYVCCWYILIPSGLRWSPADCGHNQPSWLHLTISHHDRPLPLMAPAATSERPVAHRSHRIYGRLKAGCYRQVSVHAKQDTDTMDMRLAPLWLAPAQGRGKTQNETFETCQARDILGSLW